MDLQSVAGSAWWSFLLNVLENHALAKSIPAKILRSIHLSNILYRLLVACIVQQTLIRARPKLGISQMAWRWQFALLRLPALGRCQSRSKVGSALPSYLFFNASQALTILLQSYTHRSRALVHLKSAGRPIRGRKAAVRPVGRCLCSFGQDSSPFAPTTFAWWLPTGHSSKHMRVEMLDLLSGNETMCEDMYPCYKF